MSGKRQRLLRRTGAKPPRGSARGRFVKRLLFVGTPAVLIAAIAAGYFVFFRDRPGKSSQPYSYPPLAYVQIVNSLDDLLKMKPEQLGDVDIAERNLLCAAGLKGSEKLDVGKALARLNEWADRVRFWTEHSMADFRQHPENFDNSEAKFRVLLLISVVQKDFGVRYNDRGERNCDFSNSKNAFLHGMIDDTNGGTCASMPVMYVAVGRQMGYPMSIVLAKTHVFARWFDPKTGERFNIEGTNPRFNYHPDSYYQNWPEPISEAELKQGWYLKPLTPAEELGVFLENRGNCLMDTGRYAEARAAFVVACKLAPQDPLGPDRIAMATAAMQPVVRVPRSPRLPQGRFLDENGAPKYYDDPTVEIVGSAAYTPPGMPRPPQPSMGYQPPQPGVRQASQPPTPGARRTAGGQVPPAPYTPPNPYGPQPPYQPGRP